MRSLFWFLPAIAIPLACLQLSSGQPSSTAIVNNQEKPLLPTILPQTTLATLKIDVQKPPTLAKTQPQKVIVQKQPPKAKSSNNKVNIRSYTAPAIEVRVKVSQNNNLAIASSTKANLIDGNGQVIEQLSPSEAVTWIQDSTKRCEYCINNPDNKPPLPCFELGTQVRFIASTGLIMEGDMAEVVGSQYVSNNCWSGWIYKLTNKTIYQSIFVSDFLLEIAQRGN